VPAFALGQHFLGGKAYEKYPVATLMAAALPSHLTFFGDLRELPAEVIDAAAPWLRFYKRRRALLTQLVYPLLADPIEGGWTALQSWDPDAGRGALLAFRQDAEQPSARVALRNVPPGRRFDLVRAPDERYVRTVSSAQLTSGIEVRLAAKREARVLLVLPAGRPRLVVRLRCARGGAVRAAASVRGGRAPIARARFRSGGRSAVDTWAPFQRLLRRRGRRVNVSATLRDGRRLTVARRSPACAAAAPAGPRLTG
jgi:hypothetical protein